MRFAELEEWGLRDSLLHRRDARAKVFSVIILLIAASRGALIFPAVAVALALLAARLPLVPVLLRGCVVLPFSISFALAAVVAGDPARALQTLLRSYLSAICVIVLLGCTRLPAMIDAFRRLGAPPFLLEVVQFVYRYLTLIGEQSKRMTVAAAARGARRSMAAIAGSIGVLFARSYDRAEAIHRSMLARGYNGALSQGSASFSVEDALLLLATLGVLALSLAWNHP